MTYYYRIIECATIQIMWEQLESLGRQGWKLVSVVFDGKNHIAYLSKQLED